MEDMREDATQLGEGNTDQAEAAKKAAEDTKADRERIDKEAKDKEKQLLAEKEFEEKEKLDKKAEEEDSGAEAESQEAPEEEKEESEFTEADAKNLLNQNTITVGKTLQDQFKDGISSEDKVQLLVVEKMKKKCRKRILAMIEELKVV